MSQFAIEDLGQKAYGTCRLTCSEAHVQDLSGYRLLGFGLQKALKSKDAYKAINLPGEVSGVCGRPKLPGVEDGDPTIFWDRSCCN